jgi:hypothetical protein
LRTTGIWQSWDANICSRAMARQTIGWKGHYKNERDNLRETKNVSHGKRIGGTANRNATININIKKFMRRRMNHLSHILLPPAVKQHGLVKKNT